MLVPLAKEDGQHLMPVWSHQENEAILEYPWHCCHICLTYGMLGNSKHWVSSWKNDSSIQDIWMWLSRDLTALSGYHLMGLGFAWGEREKQKVWVQDPRLWALPDNSRFSHTTLSFLSLSETLFVCVCWKELDRWVKPFTNCLERSLTPNEILSSGRGLFFKGKLNCVP